MVFSSSAPGTSAQGTAAQGTSEARSPEASRTTSRTRLTRFKLSRQRLVNRGKKRTEIVIRFRLSRAAKLVLVVRGPGPSCATVARIKLRAEKGANEYRFDGRIGKRPLKPGTYLLTPRVRGTWKDLDRAYVTIVAPGSAPGPRILPDCDQSEAADALASRPFLGGVEGTGSASPPAPLIVTLADLKPAAPDDPDSDSVGGILGDESPALPEPPPPAVFGDEDEPPLFLALALLALLGTSLIGIVVEVVRHLRSRHA